MKPFASLTPPEILALAVQNEEEDSRIFRQFANRLRADYPASAGVFDEMSEEEQRHKNALLDLFRRKHGDELPYITRQDVQGFMKRRPPIWLMEDLRLEAVRQQAEQMEIEAAAFYKRAAESARDIDTRKLLGDLALAEEAHEGLAARLGEQALAGGAAENEAATAKRHFVLQIVQPGLAGLIDGSVSTLAPIFAAAFATHSSWETFLVGMAASLGAGISMGFTEALSDDGLITGRGRPWVRGVVCGVMTALGGLGHTLPYLIPDFWTATILALFVVAIELAAIAWIRTHYMATPFSRAVLQVVLGGMLVLLTGVLIGSS